MELYLGIGDMPIYNYDKIIHTDNMCYMVVGWNERKKITPPENAKEKWFEIYNERCVKNQSNESESYYHLSHKLSYLKMRYGYIVGLVECLNEKYKIEIGKRLNKWGIAFDATKDVKSQQKELERQLRIEMQDIELTQAELNNFKGKGEPISLVKQKIRLERKLQIKINTRETTVEEWDEMVSEAIETKTNG